MTGGTTSILPIESALREAWIGGYAACIDSLRAMADVFGDEQTKVAIGVLADALEQTKP